VDIDWDPKKAAENLREHGVSFAEAATVLTDDYALTREDDDAIGEQRFVALGMSATGAMLVVVYTHRERDIYRLISSWKQTSRKGSSMKKVAAEPYRDIDFSNAKRGPVIPMEPGKTKISIRLDNAVIEYFRAQVERAGAGNYQTLLNDALVAFIQQRSVIDAVRQVVREEMSSPAIKPKQARSRAVAA
jgi:uncharacterized protein